MRTRSITNDEIALIKAMKARGMKNKDIQFFFNRPDRSVNSGRISNIETGKYGQSATIKAATDAALDTFIAGYAATPVSASIAVPGSASSTVPSSPISSEAIADLFVQDGGLFRLRTGESDEHECKAGFGFKHSAKWLRAIAALANNRGGYVLFGVHDKDAEKKDGIDLSHAVVGLPNSDFDDADTVKLTEHVKATFDPTPRIQKASADVGGKRIGVIYVDAHPSRPVIATKQVDDIREGDIFYRYPAQSSRIKYSDLRAMLDARDAQARQQMMPMLEKLLELGPDKVLLADLEAGALGDGRNVIRIDADLVERLKFIKEGDFAEKDGAPALKLLGEVEGIVGPSAAFKRGFVTKADLIADFLKQQTPADAKEYVRLAIEGTQGDWVPMHYFAQQAGLDPAGLVAFINATTAPKSRKKTFTDRAQRKSTAYKKAGGVGLQKLKEIEAGNLPPVTTEKEVAAAAAAIQGLTAKPSVPLEDLLALLASGIEVVRDIPRQVTMSVVRRAICRLDELFFGQAIP